MTEKYRAKRKDNGEWFFGYPVDSDEGWFMIDDKAVAFTDKDMDDEVSFAEACSISPDTLSRCSGLDACGQDVYEGDILRFRYNGTVEWWTAVLRFGWHDGEYGWYLEPIRDTVLTKRIGVWFRKDRLPGVTAAVIGNVWDNPEMMGV